MQRVTACIILAFLASSSQVFAQERCNAVLMPDVTQLRTSDSVRLAWISLLDREHFETAKQNLSTGATIPVDGIPIKGFLDYGSFSEARDRELSYRKFMFSQDRAMEFLQSKLSGAALDAFVKCLENDKRSQPGLHVWPKLVTDSAVDLVVLWNVPGQNLSLVTGNVQAVNTQIPNGLVPSTLLSSARWEGRFPRDKSKEFYLAISAKGYADSVRVGSEIVVAPAAARRSCEPASSNGDLGYPLSRLNMDFTADGCSDFCRVIGPPFFMLCTFGRRAGEAGQATAKVAMPNNDGGYTEHHYWVDYDGNGKIDFCRVVGPLPSDGLYSMNCQTLTNGVLGSEATIWRGGDKGYGGRWVDNNGDGTLDWCRLVGSPTSPVEKCFINTNGKLGQEEQGR